MLRLVPLHVLECNASLIEKGKTPTNEWISSFTADGSILNTEAKASEEYKRPRNTIALKLCPANTDIVDLDDDYEPERVIHSSKFDDGSVAATVSLGRNNATGIIWTAISRAVCDVTLSTTSSSSGSRRKKEIVDVASLPTGESYYDEETPPTITNSAVVDLAESPADDVMNDVKKPPPNCANRDNKRGVAVASLGMRKPAGKHHVYLDGELIDKPLGREIPLQDGSIISLLGPNGMAYQVHIFQSGDDPKAVDAICNSPKRRKTSPPLKKEETPIMEEEDAKESRKQEGNVSPASPGKIMLELPPNFSRVVKSEEYMITMNVSSDGEGNVSPVVSKVEKGKCDGDKSIGFCSVCWVKPCGLIFIPCGHVTTCHGCGVKMHVTRMKCPLCRGVITDINDVFFSGTRKSEAVNTSQGGGGKAK